MNRLNIDPKKLENLPLEQRGAAIRTTKMSDSGKYSERDYTMEFLQSYWRFVKILFFSSPFLVLSWFCFSQFLAGAPEPQWWVEFEVAVKTLVKFAVERWM